MKGVLNHQEVEFDTEHVLRSVTKVYQVLDALVDGGKPIEESLQETPLTMEEVGIFLMASGDGINNVVSRAMREIGLDRAMELTAPMYREPEPEEA